MYSLPNNCFVRARARTRVRASIPVHLLLKEVYFILINQNNVQVYLQYAFCNNIFLVNWIYKKGLLCFIKYNYVRVSFFFLSIMIIYRLSKASDAFVEIIFDLTGVVLKYLFILFSRRHPCRAQPDWTYECLTQTGPDTQICWTCPAGQD